MARKGKPKNLCELRTKKFIGKQKHFVDTFNWMKDYVDQLKGDKDERPNDKNKYIYLTQNDCAKPPVINLDFATLSADIGGGSGGDKVNIVAGDNTNMEIATSMVGDVKTFKIDVYYI